MGKFRNGFVSNSSSSSFVLIGFKKDLNKKEDGIEMCRKLGVSEERIQEELVEWDDASDLLLSTIESKDLEILFEEDLIGYMIANGNTYDFDENELPIGEIMKKVEEVASIFDVDKEDIKLFTGIMAC